MAIPVDGTLYSNVISPNESFRLIKPIRTHTLTPTHRLSSSEASHLRLHKAERTNERTNGSNVHLAAALEQFTIYK